MNRIEAFASSLVNSTELSLATADETLHLRVEIFESLGKPGHYWTRIWRLETYRLQSTFPQQEGFPAHPPSDEVIMKEFEGFESSLSVPKRLSGGVEARSLVLSELADWLDALSHPD